MRSHWAQIRKDKKLSKKKKRTKNLKMLKEVDVDGECAVERLETPTEESSGIEIQMYRVVLKGLQRFEISRCSAAKGEKPAPICLYAIFRKIDQKSRNHIQALQVDVCK